MWCEPPRPLSRVSGAIVMCIASPAAPPIPFFVFRAGFLCSAKHQNDNLCDFILLGLWLPGWGVRHAGGSWG